ncbi:hypothetical protein [Nocardia sp. NPDC058705]|uniref:hypothetical protein n=1 Tax=Nocardia sp. NPDC058705 TaxID=3346609 RepID=UPI0036891FF3
MGEQSISVAIPEGYAALPLADIVENGEHLYEFGPQTTAGTPSIVSALTALTGTLVDNGTRYCGIGAHRLPDGDPLYSCLTVTVRDTVGGPRNPRLVLSDLVRSRSADGTLGLSALVETDTHPVLFTEKVGSAMPGQSEENQAPAVYQLQAVVPSEDGNSLVAIEFATPDTERGIACRKMISDMARSVKFGPQVTSSLNL